MCLSRTSVHLIENIPRQFQIVSEPKFNCNSLKFFLDNSNWFLSQFQLHLIEIVPTQFQNVSWPKFHCISSKFLWDLSKLCLSRNSIACDLNYSKTFPGCALAKIQLHIIGTILRQSQIVPWPKFHCISSKLLWEISTLCLSQNSKVPHRNYSQTSPKSALAEIQLHLIGNYSRTIPNCVSAELQFISSKIFHDNSKLCVGRNSIASPWSCSKTIPNCVSAEIQLHFIEINLRLFQIVCKAKFNCTSLELV